MKHGSGLKSEGRSLHQNPGRYDDDIDNIHDQFRKWFSTNEYRTLCSAEYVGKTLKL